MRPSETPGLYLDDLHVGQRFESDTLQVQRDDILRFAREFDPQHFHMDEASARDTLFGGLAASGWHTAALTMRLLVDGGLPLAMGIVGAGAEVTWPCAVRPGDTLRVRSEVVEIIPSASRPDRARVSVRSQTLNQAGEVVQTTIAKLLVFRRPRI